ncbi:MAG: hypothetical protein LC745_11845 [Planctomycetia bacterium]|nr:hypothetical protein [Planctomycetia bacterium]
MPLFLTFVSLGRGRQLDFKGPVEVARRKVTPLSVLDDQSRYLHCLRPCTDMPYATVQAALWDPFGDVGLPEQLLCGDLVV